LHIGVDGRELLGRPTGVGRYVREVLLAWLSDPRWPHRLTVFLPQAPPSDLVRALPGVTWVHDTARHGGTWWEQMRLPALVRRAGPDVLFAPAYTAPIRLGCPYVVLIHDVSFCAHPEWFGAREGLRRRWLTRYAAHHAAGVLTVSEFSASETVRWLGIDRARIELAPPGAPHASNPKPPNPEPRTRNPVVLYVGSLFNRRHIPELIAGFARAAARVPDARLEIIGDNRTRPHEDPRLLASRHGVADKVVWREYVSDADLDRAYLEARVFVLLSDYEGFLITPFEAIAHGVPPVLLDTPVSREIQGNAAALVTLDSTVIGDTLARLLTDDEAHAELVAAGQPALARFSWTATAAAVRRALERAARPA
jgi:glycosyltransferase involved in cell wall biosynthesis